MEKQILARIQTPANATCLATLVVLSKTACASYAQNPSQIRINATLIFRDANAPVNTCHQSEIGELTAMKSSTSQYNHRTLIPLLSSPLICCILVFFLLITYSDRAFCRTRHVFLQSRSKIHSASRIRLPDWESIQIVDGTAVGVGTYKFAMPIALPVAELMTRKVLVSNVIKSRRRLEVTFFFLPAHEADILRWAAHMPDKYPIDKGICKILVINKPSKPDRGFWLSTSGASAKGGDYWFEWSCSPGYSDTAKVASQADLAELTKDIQAFATYSPVRRAQRLVELEAIVPLKN
jgi:hypothetical protein